MKNKKINYRKTIFPKKPSYSNIMYYNSLTKLLLGIIVIILGFIIFHFVTVDHNKVKIKTIKAYKDRYIIPENIVFLGDSITKLYDLDKYYPDNNVVNSGVSGDVAEDILSDMKNRVYKYNPSKIFLLIGTNQLVTDSEEEIIEQIFKVVDEIHSNNPVASVYLESIYPVNNNIEKSPAKNRDNDKIVDINNKLKEKSKKYKYEYVDIYSELIDSEKNLKEEYTKDGLHLNDKGYEVVTEIIKKYL